MIKVVSNSLAANKGAEYFILPDHPNQTVEEYENHKEMISQLMELPDQKKLEQDTWINTAVTIENLLQDAKFFAPLFVDFLQSTIQGIDQATVSFGPNNAFMLKSPSSLRRKIDAICREMSQVTKFEDKDIEKKVIQSAWDSIRGTIVIDTVDALKNTIYMLKFKTKENGWALTINNLWNKPSTGYASTGYVGIHTAIQMISGGKSIIAELQIHFSQMFDGSPTCPKERSHIFYERTRIVDMIALNKDEKRFFSSISESVTKRIFLDPMKDIAKQINQSKL